MPRPASAKKSRRVPEGFLPHFWNKVDGRLSAKKKIRQRYEELKRDSGADSAQKGQLCQRAAFISVQIETMECIAAEGGELDAGIYTQSVNALSGLLSKLGLEKQAKEKEHDLRAYIEVTFPKNGGREP
jgi:hypothetical protein